MKKLTLADYADYVLAALAVGIVIGFPVCIGYPGCAKTVQSCGRTRINWLT
jgi:hypothetical protein